MVRSRASLLASSTVLATVAGHSAAAGMLPQLAPTALAAMIATALAVAFAQRRRGAVAIAAFAMGTQLLLHAVLTLGDHAHAGASLLPSAAMVTAHLVIALLLAVVALEAERIITAIRRLLRLTAPQPVPMRQPARVLLTRQAPVLYCPPVDRALAGRGPPRCS